MDALREYCFQLREHVANSERNLDSAQISLDAISSYEIIMKTKLLSEENLLKIMDSAKSRYLGSYYIGTSLVLALLKDFPRIEVAWRELADSSSAHERWVAISIVRDERIHYNFALELVKHAINDKSLKVRLFAIECIYIRDLSSLLPDLKKRAEVENNMKVLQSIEWLMSRMN